MRSRLTLAGLLALGVGASGLAMERLAPPERGRPAIPVGEPSGAWLCPHGGGEDWRVWLSMANPAAEEGHVRVTTLALRREAAIVEDVIPPRGSRILEVEAPRMASASMVETFGAPVVAAMGVQPAAGGTAAEACARAPSTSWHLPGGSSERGRETWLILMNPFATHAVVDVAVSGVDRRIQPKALRGVVLAPRRSVALDLGRYALGEEAIGATAQASLGRAAAALVTVTQEGVESVLGSPRLSRGWIIPGGLDDAPGGLDVLAGDLETPIRAARQTAGTEDVLTDVGVGAGQARRFSVPAGGGLEVSGEGPRPFASSRRVVAEGAGDAAASLGVASPAARWVVPPAGPPGAPPGSLILQNPGTVPASVRLRLLPGTAPPAVTVAPGGTEVVDREELSGSPTGVEVIAETGAVVPGIALLWDGGYSLLVGAPVSPSPGVD